MELNNLISQARLDANRANAQFSNRIQNKSPEEQEAFNQLRTLQLAEHDPQTSSEWHLFEEILHSMWILEKARIRQGQMLDAEGLDGLQTEDGTLQKTYDRLERYATRAQNTWFRCRKMLKIVQNERIAIQSQAEMISPDELVEELKKKARHEHEPPPPPPKTSTTEPTEEGPSEVDRKIRQLDPTDPQFQAKAERLIQESLLAEFAKLAKDLANGNR